MSRLLSFHRGEGTDGRGRTLAQIQSLSHDQMESIHDFIQWMFPTRGRSAYNPAAPVLTDADVAAFQADPVLRDNLGRSFQAFLNFLGLAHDTRVLICLKTLGLDDEARALFEYLARAKEQGIGIDDETFAYWRDAANGRAR
jgi:hypothetical protein